MMLYPIADAHCDRLSKGMASSVDVTFESLRQGNVACQFFALFASAQQGDPYGRAREQLQVFHAICGEHDGWRILHTVTPSLPGEYTAAILTIEGGEILEGKISRLEEFYLEGVRAVALTWNHPNEIGFPAKTNGGGLTVVGKELVARMRRRNIAVDVSHLSEEGFWDVEKLCGPFMATHSNAKSLCNHFRNLTDDQIRAVFDHGGFIGVCFYPPFLRDDGEENGASYKDVIRHVEHYLRLGGEKYIGFGSDFDGMNDKTRGIEYPAHFQNLMREMEKRGYPERVLRGIAGENLVAFYDRLFWS